MKAYIGTKVVQAEPQPDPNVEEGAPRRPGYKVMYEDGYVSWSPKDVFERCYREITADETDLVMTGDRE